MADEQTSSENTQGFDEAALVSKITGVFQEQIDGLKSSYDSQFARLNNDLNTVVSGKSSASPSTEKGKELEEVANRRQAEQFEDRVKQTAEDRDNYWMEYNSAVYENKLPKEAFEGFTSAAEIKRQTAVLRSVMGLNNKADEQQKGIGSGEQETPSAPKFDSKIDQMAAYLAKNSPIPGRSN